MTIARLFFVVWAIAGTLLLPGCSKHYRVGDRVLVEWENNDYPAFVLSLEAPGRVRVHFEGYDAIWDETVPATRVKGLVKGVVRHPPPPAKIRVRMLSSAAVPASLYKAGDRVRAQWKESWYPAIVVTVLGGETYRIHYEGYDANWDENVDVSRVQRRLRMSSPLERRAFLGSMVGVAAAEMACRRAYQEVPGSIRDPGAAIGHLLRQVPEFGEPVRTENVPVVIVGAGPSGLAAAWRLRRLGEPGVVLLELEGRAGGTSQYDTDGVVPYPWGAHYVPAPRAENRAFVTLLDELGALEGKDDEGQPIVREELLVRDPEERLFHGGTWHPGLFPKAGASTQDLTEWALFQQRVKELASRRDGRGRRAFAIPMEHGGDDGELRALDRISMAEWLQQQRITSPRVRWWVEYACRDDYGLRLTETSAWAGLFYFASRLNGAGQAAAPLIAWPEGNGRLVRHLAGVVEDALRLRTLVVDVASFEDHAEVLAFDVARQQTIRYRASRVIFAAPKFLAPRLLRSVRDNRPAWCSAFTYGAWMVANVHLREHPRSSGTPLAWDNVIYGSPSLGYVVATHQAQRDAGPTILTYYYPYVDADPTLGRQRLLTTRHGELADVVLADLSPAHHRLDRLVERVDIWRWGHGMIRPQPGFLWGGDRVAAAAVVGKVHMAHSDLSGLALFEESLHHGVRAAEEVFAELHPARAATMTRLA